MSAVFSLILALFGFSAWFHAEQIIDVWLAPVQAETAPLACAENEIRTTIETTDGVLQKCTSTDTADDLTELSPFLSYTVRSEDFVRMIVICLMGILGLGILMEGSVWLMSAFVLGFVAFLSGHFFMIAIILLMGAGIVAGVGFMIEIYRGLHERFPGLIAYVKTWWRYGAHKQHTNSDTARWAWWDESRQADNRILDAQYTEEWKGKKL